LFRITNYGRDVVIKVLIVSFILIVVPLFFENPVLGAILNLAALFILSFTLYFFRDPERRVPKGVTENTVISPADGKVVKIEDIIFKDNNIFGAGEKIMQVSIFLSPLNVHVNRIPVSGTVKYFNYIRGEYLVAFDHKSSERNERTEIGIITESGKPLIFKQIAGFVARRIVCSLKQNDTVQTGERFGMIKFGSRVDILLNRSSIIKVSVGQKVKAGESIIAEL